MRERGQAIIEYALIAVLVGIAFGLALAASAPVTSNLFNAVVNDILQQTVVGDAPDRDEFWGTVTKVFEFTPTGGAVATNTPANPTDIPTAGPSPTPTNTYTATVPAPTSTPTLTPTYGDDYKDAPFKDTADEGRRWRIDNNIALGGLPWTGEFYPNRTLSGTPDHVISGIWALDYNGEFVAGWRSTDFSATFTRTIELPSAMSLSFRVVTNDGARVRLDGSPVTIADSNGDTNSWKDQAATLYTGSLSVAAGAHTIEVDYYQAGGTSILKVEVLGSGANPDDSAVDGTGTVSGGSFNCGWGISDDENDSNTERNLFDDYVLGDNQSGTLCYLEWRGAVRIPASMTNPQMIFWDTWDFGSAGTDGWLEVAEYIPVDPLAFPPTANRSAMTWQKIDLGRAGTTNFNWTRNVVDLAPYMTGFTSNRLTFRFAMRISSGAGGNRQWHVDDVEFKDKTQQTFNMDRLWTLNNADERFDFITTGGINNPGDQKSGWALVSNNKFGPNGLAFHDSADDTVDTQDAVAGTNGSVFTYYKRHNDSPVSNNINDVRVNYLEFDGFIDLTTLPATDSFGNDGDPVLSFYQGYHVGSRTGLVVQYSTTPYDVAPAVWTTFPDGEIRPITATGEIKQTTLQETVISLKSIPGAPTQIRIRFAMLVHAQADTKDGWWIDQIRLGRDETPKYTDYPFSDDVQNEGPLYFWRYTGTWGPTDEHGHVRVGAPATDVEYSYGASPNSNYIDGQTTYLTLRWPIDLYNDTTGKIVLIGPGVTTGTNSYSPAATNPVLTFFHRRELASADQFIIQWKRVDEPDTDYRTLWIYRHNMGRAINRTWEPTKVSLYPILRQIALDGGGAPGVGTGAALRDDDVVIRFALGADASASERGIYIDDIRFGEDATPVWRLWPVLENRNDWFTGTTIGSGSGSTFFSEPDGSVDGRRFENDWKLGGTWNAVDFEARAGSGAMSFHDSVLGGQDRAPVGYDSDFGDSAWATLGNTYSILELDRVFDLRGVYADDEAPVLNFWSRYHIGRNTTLRVQVSREDTRSLTAIDTAAQTTCGPNILQCYTFERGWLPWADVTSPYFPIGSTSGDSKSYGWRRYQIDLSPYAYSVINSTAGSRIRIRFVYDALTTTTNYDGWYLDGIDIRYRTPYSNITVIQNSNFIDYAGSMVNWIPEGLWGLDPNITLGGSGAIVNLGVWTGNWINCADCESIGAGLGYTGGNRYRMGVDHVLEVLNRTPVATVPYTQINIAPSCKPVTALPSCDYFAGEFTLDVLVDGVSFQNGVRNFSTRSDDGVRLKVEELDSGGTPIPPTPFTWNVINNWTDHGPTTNTGSFNFLFGRRYRLTLQFYEKTGGAVIQLSVSDGSYSFSDSPKYGGGLTPDIPPLAYANTSLLGNHVLDLTTMDPGSYALLGIENKYRSHTYNQLRVEVSTDGGFTWVGKDSDHDGGASDDADYGDGVVGLGNPYSDPWQLRTYNLSAYNGKQILLRFRYDRQNSDCYRRWDCDNSNAISNPSLNLVDGYYDGWWIASIRVLKFP
ncbi:MAG: PA14 domain-containing protein [Chloroflexi bacterium OLB13]|nr:MAG: PA14 domain-containing protein [Chloroflexi bacterium OLB13]